MLFINHACSQIFMKSSKNLSYLQPHIPRRIKQERKVTMIFILNVEFREELYIIIIITFCKSSNRRHCQGNETVHILIQCKRYTDVKIASLKVSVIMKTYQCQVSHNFHEKQFMGMRFLNASNKER